MSLVLTNSAKRAMLNELTYAGGELDGVMVMLYTNSISPTGATTFDDLEEADFENYSAAGPVEWGTAFSSGDTAVSVGANLQFDYANSTTPNTITGYAVYQPGSPNKLMFAENLDENANLSADGDSLVVIPRFTLT